MNERVRPIHWVFLALSVVFQATAVVLGKTAALHLGAPTIGGFLASPWYLGGLACLVLQALSWQIVLRGVRFFVAYLVMTSLNYPLVLIASRVFFSEHVTPLNIVGAAFIVVGVYLTIREDLP